MNDAAASWRHRAAASLQHLAWLACLGWLALAPVSAAFVHTTDRTLAVPLQVLGAAVAVLLAARGCLPASARLALVRRADAPLLLLAAVWLGSAALLDDAVAWRNATQISAALALAYVFGRIAATLPAPERPLRTIVLPVAVAMTAFAVAEVAVGANWFYERIPGNPYYAPYRELCRPVATQFNPAALATFLLATSALALGALSPARRRLGAGLAVGLGLALLFVRSRAAFAGLCAGAIAASLAGTTPASRAPRRRLAIAAAAAAVAVVAISSLLPPPFDQFGLWRTVGSGGLLAQDRQIRLDAALAMWRDRPWLGVGFDGFPSRFALYVPDPRLAPLGGTPDNGWLALLVENGLCGGAAFVWFVGALLLGAARTLRRAPANRPLRFATAGLVALLVNLVGYTYLAWTTPCALLGLLCGTVAGQVAALEPPGEGRAGSD
jgi:O-antigen ligase